MFSKREMEAKSSWLHIEFRWEFVQSPEVQNVSLCRTRNTHLPTSIYSSRWKWNLKSFPIGFFYSTSQSTNCLTLLKTSSLLQFNSCLFLQERWLEPEADSIWPILQPYSTVQWGLGRWAGRTKKGKTSLGHNVRSRSEWREKFRHQSSQSFAAPLKVFLLLHHICSAKGNAFISQEGAPGLGKSMLNSELLVTWLGRRRRIYWGYSQGPLAQRHGQGKKQGGNGPISWRATETV